MRSSFPRAMRGSGVLAAALLLAAMAPRTARAQIMPDSLAAEVARLRARVDSLSLELTRIAADGAPPEEEDTLAALRDARHMEG